jgi:hypothetical protein
MKREAQLKIYKQIKNYTIEQQLKYFKKIADEFSKIKKK